MARYTENIVVAKPFEPVWLAVYAALRGYNWNVVTVRDNTYYIKERLSLETMIWRNPCRFAIHVAREDDANTRLFFMGSTLGFGPLPKGRIRRIMATLRAQVDAAVAQAEVEPAPPAA